MYMVLSISICTKPFQKLSILLQQRHTDTSAAPRTGFVAPQDPGNPVESEGGVGSRKRLDSAFDTLFLALLYQLHPRLDHW